MENALATAKAEGMIAVGIAFVASDGASVTNFEGDFHATALAGAVSRLLFRVHQHNTDEE